MVEEGGRQAEDRVWGSVGFGGARSVGGSRAPRWMEGIGRKCGWFRIIDRWNPGRRVGVHLGAVRAQMSMGVLESGDGTVTQAPRDRHQCVEIL